MKYLSVCSGIEAATVAWHPLGWEPLAFSEIEPFPRKVLAHHYPNVPCHGDFTVLRDQNWIGDADLLVGGTPCQAFSVAGLRQSLSDDRGNLTLEFVRLADAIDNIRHNTGRKPAIIVWENVPGVLSVKDNAFGCFLAALVGNDAPLIPTGGKWTNAGLVIGPKRSAAWRVLDAQYFGVAQRRRRVFVVAGSGDGFDPSQILFEFDGMRRDTAPSRKAGEKSAPTVTSGPPFSRTGNDRVEADAYVAGTLNARTGLSRGVQDAESGHMIVHGTQDPCVSDIAFAQGRNSGGENVLVQTVGTLTRASSAGGTITQQDIQAGHLLVQPIPFGIGEASDVGHCLRSGASKADKHESTTYVAQPYSIMPMNSGKDYKARETDVAQPLMTSQVGGNQGGDYVVQSIGFYANQGAHGTGKTEEISVTLKAHQTKNLAAVAAPMAVRRLTPRECERLQGFPDDYTDILNAADGPRYKALGNSMAVPVMAWIGRRIADFGGLV